MKHYCNPYVIIDYYNDKFLSLFSSYNSFDIIREIYHRLSMKCVYLVFTFFLCFSPRICLRRKDVK